MDMGLDEVNFSPTLAGDCVVCALACDDPVPMKDSKAQTHRQRLESFSWIQGHALYAIQPASISDIRAFGIYRARNLAAIAALASIGLRIMEVGSSVGFVYCDTSLAQGLKGSPWNGLLKAVRGGDHPLINAASVAAKVYFDAMMEGFGKFWPGYGLEQDHGSVSTTHRRRLREVGPSPVHRQWNYAADWWKNVLEG